MARRWPAALLCWAAAAALLAAAVECAVTYDKKAVLIDGQRRILFSGSIHYPRSTPEVTAFFEKCLLSFFLLCRGSFLGGLWRGSRFLGGDAMKKVKCSLFLRCFGAIDGHFPFLPDIYRFS